MPSATCFARKAQPWLCGALLSISVSAVAQAATPEDISSAPDMISLEQGQPLVLEDVQVIAERTEPQMPDSRYTSDLEGAAHTQPLSIQSVDRATLEERGARTLSTAVETVSAVQAPVDIQLQPGGVFAIRGFNAAVLRDGFATFALLGERDSLVGVERIDVIKGPGSALNNGSLGLPPGGAIDLQSDWSGDASLIDARYSRSAFNENITQLELDSGDWHPMLSLGFAGVQAQAHTFFDFGFLDSERLRPSASLRLLNSRVSVYYDRNQRRMIDHPGLPTTGTLDQSQFRIPDHRSVNDPDVPESITGTTFYGFDIESDLYSWLSLDLAGRQTESELQQASQFVQSNTPDLGGSRFSRLGGTYVQTTEQTQFSSTLRLSLPLDQWSAGWTNTPWGWTRHLGKLSAWLGYARDEVPDQIDLRIGLASPLDLADPVYGRWTDPIAPFGLARSLFEIDTSTLGLQWRWRDRINLFYAHVDTQGRVSNNQQAVSAAYLGDLSGGLIAHNVGELIAQTVNGILSSGLVPDLGLAADRVDNYDLSGEQMGLAVRVWGAGSTVWNDGLWVFAGRGDGVQFQSYLTGEGSPLPGFSDQREAGIRLVQRDWGQLSVTQFRIQRRNVPTADPNSVTGFTVVTTGLQEVRGIDADLTLKPSADWAGPWLSRLTLFAAGAWLDSELVRDNTFPEGNTLPNVPQRSWRIQLAARVLDGPAPTSAFITRRCQTAVFGDLANNFQVPGRCLTDAGIRGSWRGLGLDVVVTNLSNRQFYEPYVYLFNGVIPGADRVVRASVEYRFGRD